MKHLKKIAKGQKKLITTFFIMGLLITFLQNFGPLYFQIIIDNFSAGTLTLFNIAIYGITLILLYVVTYLWEFPWRKLKTNIAQNLKLLALRKVAVIDYLAYAKLGTGVLIQQIENGAAAGKAILFDFYLRLASELLPAMIFSIIFVFAINHMVMLAILVGYIVVFIVSNILLKALYKVKGNILVNEEKFNHFLVRGFMEMVVFRVNRRFVREIKKAEKASKEIISSTVKVTMVHEAFFAIFAIFIGFVKIGIIIYGWRTNVLTIGQIVALIALVDNAYTPIAIFNVIYIQYKLDRVTFNRYAKFLDAKEDARLGQGKIIPELTGSITFSQVDFSYNERKIFDDFNLSINENATTAFVGESGSGKSTAVKLIIGLLQPDTGAIVVDEFDLEEVNLNSYYEQIIYLPQEPSIFDGTLRENLVFDERIDDDIIIKAIHEAGLDGLYAKLENGLDTQLGEKGVSLSGGERQQLALARLWFSNAKIVILDEATSAIDNLTEEAIMEKVMILLQGKTVIAIAHRLDSIKLFDHILLFRNGQIIEQGQFDALLEKRQHFYELYNRHV